MAKSKGTEFQITIGYRAVILVTIKADNEDEAKKKALEEFEKYRHFGDKCDIQDDSFNAYGCLNMDKTWNAI